MTKVAKVKNILVSQPVPADLAKSPYGEIIKKYNVNIDFIKFFKIERVSVREFRDQKVYIDQYTAIIFNSKNAVDYFFTMAKDVRVEIPDTMKYFCLSESIAYYLQKYVQFRKRKIFSCDQNLQNLMDLIKKNKNEKFLYPCSENPNKEIPDLLEANKITYSIATLYRTVPEDMKAAVDISKYDMLVFFSPQGIKSLFYNWADFKQDKTIIGAFGTNTAQAAKEAGLEVNVFAPNEVTPSITTAIDNYLMKLPKNK